MILIINEKARKDLAFSSRSKNPNIIEVTPTVPIPKFSVNFIPMRFIFAPEIKVKKIININYTVMLLVAGLLGFQLTLFQPEGQIMPTTLLLAPPPSEFEKLTGNKDFNPG